MLKTIKHIFGLIWKMQVLKWKLRQATRADRKRRNREYFENEIRGYKLSLSEASVLIAELTKTCPVRYDSKDIDFIAASEACSKCKPTTDCKRPELCWFTYLTCRGCFDLSHLKCDEADANEISKIKGFKYYNPRTWIEHVEVDE